MTLRDPFSRAQSPAHVVDAGRAAPGEAAAPATHSRRVFVWDGFVRLFHWALVAGLAANAVVTDPEEGLHRLIGYGVLALLGLRLLWGLVGSRHARFRDFPPDPAAALGQLAEIARGRRRIHIGHSPLGALMIYNLLATVAAIGISGHMQVTLTFFGVDWVAKLHAALVFWVEVSAAVHVAAVIYESRRLRINLPRAMVTGYKDLPRH